MNLSPAKTPGRSRVLITEDYPLVREGLKELFERTADLVCCGEAETIAETRKAIAQLQPDLLLLDLRLHQEECFELIKELISRWPELKVLVLSQHDETIYAERVLKAGGLGYVQKENAPKEILFAIRRVLQGEIYVSQKISSLAVRKLAGKSSRSADQPVSAIQNLTDRELQIFELLGIGLSSKKISIQLGLSLKTIESHRENLKRKLGLADAAALVHHAILYSRKTTGIGDGDMVAEIANRC